MKCMYMVKPCDGCIRIHDPKRRTVCHIMKTAMTLFSFSRLSKHLGYVKIGQKERNADGKPENHKHAL